jgi:hypothetical protein
VIKLRFGTRTSVRDAHDRYASQEVSHLVERMARERDVEMRWQPRRARRGRGTPTDAEVNRR